MDNRIPLVVIVGSTAVGKTDLAIQLAGTFSGEIISADSRLFYRGMDIGTAKPTLEQRQRVVHHLIDVADPQEIWSLALFQRAAHAAIKDCYKRGKLPFLVGGTGQYIHALLGGWTVPMQTPDMRLRKVLEAWAEVIGYDGLHSRLASIDQAAAKAIDPRNLRRTVRALEVIFRTGRRFSEQRRQVESPYRQLIIGLMRPRNELYQRIDQRIDQMMMDGFVDEVKRLLDKKYSLNSPALSAIGYREIASYLTGQISLDEAITLIKRYCRQFVRRQANWFKENDPGIYWFQMDAGVVERISTLIKEWLSAI